MLQGLPWWWFYEGQAGGAGTDTPNNYHDWLCWWWEHNHSEPFPGDAQAEWIYEQETKQHMLSEPGTDTPDSYHDWLCWWWDHNHIEAEYPGDDEAQRIYQSETGDFVSTNRLAANGTITENSSTPLPSPRYMKRRWLQWWGA